MGWDSHGTMGCWSWRRRFERSGSIIHGGDISCTCARSCHLVSTRSQHLPRPIAKIFDSCYQLFITIGIFTADAINYGTETRSDTGSYRIPMGVGYIWALMLGVGILFLPETPRYDFNHGRQDHGLTTMSKFYGIEARHPLIQREAAEIEKIREATQGDHPWYEALTGPRMMYRVALGMTLQMLQQLTGATEF